MRAMPHSPGAFMRISMNANWQLWYLARGAHACKGQAHNLQDESDVASPKMPLRNGMAEDTAQGLAHAMKGACRTM